MGEGTREEPTRRAAPGGLSRRRGLRRGPHGYRRSLPGDRRERAVRRALARRAAPARVQRARRPPRGWHDSRVEDHDQGSGMTELGTQIKEIIDNEDVTLFMKGTPQMVMCGNSHRALEALRRAGAPVTAIDILPDPRIREELSTQSGWPTIPQVFVRGELIGGADIVEELEQTGELERTLTDKLGPDYRGAADERVVAVD